MYAKWRQFVGDPLMPKEWPHRVRIGLNGFDSLARMLLRCSLDDKRGIDVVAINEPTLTPEQMLYLIKYDTSNGPFRGFVRNQVIVCPPKSDKRGEYCSIEIAGRLIGVFHEVEAEKIPWDWLDVEYVLETTGKLTRLSEALKHVEGGRARKVLVVGDAVDIPLLMYPISCRGYQRGTSIVASGSSIAHAVATIVSIIETSCAMEECIVTILLPAGAQQNLVDGPTKNPRSWRLGRSAMQSIIPGRCPDVVQSVIQAIPSLQGRLDAIVMHVPTFSGAVVDLTCRSRVTVGSVSEVIDQITRSTLLEKYNSLHSSTQPFIKSECDLKKPRPVSAASMPTSLDVSNSERSNSVSSAIGTGRADISQAIQMPHDLTSIMVPLKKEDAFVSTDATGKHTLSLLSMDCCICLPAGHIMKFVSWFDPCASYCERILDTVVFMRGVDET
ncbi:unnamed protein product [Calicophoron daubneyi]|uniref:Glyceraldehyde 3-phosphate dehydrogenase NAD(P) binding domain-containing protein n=2 Tax=Calicophoron daubneyi TaxID=300641 RepID=A0AAV2T9Q3_CALDB